MTTDTLSSPKKIQKNSPRIEKISVTLRVPRELKEGTIITQSEFTPEKWKELQQSLIEHDELVGQRKTQKYDSVQKLHNAILLSQ